MRNYKKTATKGYASYILHSRCTFVDHPQPMFDKYLHLSSLNSLQYRFFPLGDSNWYSNDFIFCL